jgi:multicomponent Na+:H+ antiporter subunit D
VSTQTLLVSALATPLLAAFGIVTLRRRPSLRDALSVAAGVVLSSLTVALALRVRAGDAVVLHLIEVAPGLHLSFAPEPLGAGFGALASTLWTITTLYALGYARALSERNQTRQQFFFAIAMASTVAAAYTENLFALFVFYETLTLATVPLVAHAGGEKVRGAVRVYVGYLLGTSILLLFLAIAWVYAVTGTLQFVPGGIMEASDGPVLALLILFVLGTGKAALMPFHRWLPAAMVAPTPVSALLHAVAVVKLGVFVILKVSVYVFGFDLLQSSGAAAGVLPLAIVTLVLGAIFALREDDLKRRLAYSTVSQLAYVVVGALLASGLGLLAAGMQVVSHALAKITLFFCAGAALARTGRTKVSQLGGVGRAMPLTMTAWLVASFSIVGLPLTGGFWAKWTLGLAAVEQGRLLVVGVVLAGSLLSLAYLVTPGIRSFFAAPDGAALARAEAPASCLTAIWITAGLSLALFFLSGPIFGFLETVP